MKRKKIIIGNWKMNKTIQETQKFFETINSFLAKNKNEDYLLGIAPSYLSLQVAKNLSKEVLIAAQNCHYEENGAFTGEVSVTMLQEIGIHYCIIGHSERRSYYQETSESCNLKIKKLFEKKMIPIYCVGETLQQYEQGMTKETIYSQLEIGLQSIPKEDVEKMIFAYEPVWSIGTGKNASKEIAEDICAFIRLMIENLYDQETAKKVLIQYGGSVKPSNIAEYLNQSNIDGALVGGASLKEESFKEMISELF